MEKRLNERGWHQEFDNVTDFVDFIATPPTYRPEGRASQRFIKDGWNGTRSFSEALELALVGWPEGVALVDAFRDRLQEAIAGALALPAVEYDVVGDYVDVGRLVTGEPEFMGYVVDSETHIDSFAPRIVRVVVNIAVSSVINPETIKVKGAAIAALVCLLEQSGKRCEVDVVCGIAPENYRARGPWLVKVRVKDADEALQIDKLAMLVSHPSSLRRLFFAAVENNDADVVDAYGLRDDIGYYGTPTEIPEDEEDTPPEQRRRGDVYIGSWNTGVTWTVNGALRWLVTELEKAGVTLALTDEEKAGLAA